MVKCIEQFLLLKRFETIHTATTNYLDNVFKLQSPCTYFDGNCSSSKIDVNQFPLVTGSLPLLRQMVKQAPIVDTSKDVLVKKVILVLGRGEAVQYLPLCKPTR
jgi:hypothetical protein